MVEKQRRLTVEINEKVEMDGLEIYWKVEIDGELKNLEGGDNQ